MGKVPCTFRIEEKARNKILALGKMEDRSPDDMLDVLLELGFSKYSELGGNLKPFPKLEELKVRFNSEYLKIK